MKVLMLGLVALMAPHLVAQDVSSGMQDAHFFSHGLGNGRYWNAPETYVDSDLRTGLTKMLRIAYLTGIRDLCFMENLRENGTGQMAHDCGNFFPPFGSPEDVINKLTHFYREPYNLDIPILWALKLLTAEATGKLSPEEYKKALVALRMKSAH